MYAVSVEISIKMRGEDSSKTEINFFLPPVCKKPLYSIPNSGSCADTKASCSLESDQKLQESRSGFFQDNSRVYLRSRV